MRFPILVAAAVALLGGPLVAAPVPKGAERKPYYFPIEVGATWVYETDTGTETMSVSAVEKTDSGLLVSRTGANGNRVAYTKTVVSADGLRRHGDEAADWLLKTNVTAGDSWESTDGKRTVHGPEEIRVPAGKFNALRVVREQYGVTYTSWYAPGVGEVKRVKKIDGIETVTRTLNSFLPKDGK
jgi:hypothetical protein